MELKEFLEKLKKLSICVYTKTTDRYNRGFEYENTSKVKIDENNYLYESWMSGGVTGGSCWDNGDATYHSMPGEKEPEFQSLDLILESICPEITFLKYKNLCKCVEYGKYSRNEYYGNSTEYGIKYIKLIDLYNALKEHSII